MNAADFYRTFREAPRRAIFCGAGVSRSAPSCIPLFSELMSSYLAALQPPGRNVLEEHAGKEAACIGSAICELPIDEFFADVMFALESSALEPLDWMHTRLPNQSHHAIAVLAESLNISTVLTPNFDTLIETTLPEFECVSLMKRRSRTGEDMTLGRVHLPGADYTSMYLDPSLKKVFHLHGTSLGTRLEITPGATSLPFDHFDHASLAERLGGATLLVVGSSGGWDYDILDVLKRCDIAQVLWVCHGDNDTITTGEVPLSWLTFFNGRAEAIRGDTTRILAELARVEHEEVAAEGVSEFTDHVVGHFKDCPSNRKLHCWAALVNKVMRGDIADSILTELEREPKVRIEQSEGENEKERKFLEAIEDADYLTMRDGRRITPEQFMDEYESRKRVYARIREGYWRVLIGRARTVAMSRNPLREKNLEELLGILRSQVIEELERILPYESIGPQEMVEFTWIAREWMLAHESAGILYYEFHKATAAALHLKKALRMCRNEEDRYRIQTTMIIVTCMLKLTDLLDVGSIEAVQALLKDPAAEIDAEEAGDLMVIADQIFLGGGRRQALDVYESITQRWPDNVLACLNYSNMRRAMQDFNGALKELDRCLKNKPHDHRLHCNKGYALNELGRQRDAIPILERALELCASDKHAWVNLGNSYYETNRLREAKNKYQEALRLDPGFEVARINMENTMRRLAK